MRNCWLYILNGVLLLLEVFCDLLWNAKAAAEMVGVKIKEEKSLNAPPAEAESKKTPQHLWLSFYPHSVCVCVTRAIPCFAFFFFLPHTRLRARAASTRVSTFPIDVLLTNFVNSGHLTPMGTLQLVSFGLHWALCWLRTSLTAHMRAMEPMLLVMVTSVALARSSLLMLSRFSLLIMWPKLSGRDKRIGQLGFGRNVANWQRTRAKKCRVTLRTGEKYGRTTAVSDYNLGIWHFALSLNLWAQSSRFTVYMPKADYFTQGLE